MSAVDDAKSILGSANSTAQHVRAVHLTFLLLITYFAVIIGSTTDIQLLKVSPVTLPLLNVELPILEFYALAPWFVLLMHFNLLLQSYLLGRKLHLFNQHLKDCDKDVANDLRDQLFSFALSHNIVMNHHPGLMRFLLNSMIVISIVVLPLVVLTWAQTRFIPFHSEAITWSHRVVVALDCVMLWAFWPRIMLPDDQQGLWWEQVRNRITKKIKTSRNAIGSKIQFIGEVEIKDDNEPLIELQRTSGQKSLLLSSTILLFISWFIAVIPDDEKPELSQASTAMVDVMNNLFMEMFNIEIKGLFRQNLYIKDAVLVKNEPSAKVIVALKSEDTDEKHTAFDQVIGLNLATRDMRNARFQNCVMPKVNLAGAKLNGIEFSNVQMQGSNLVGAKLKNAEMLNVSMQGANMTAANLLEAVMSKPNLKGVNMTSTNLQGATLSYANMQGVNLNWAQLQGADLANANLQSANLNFAQLQGANLESADLRGADLSNANLSGALLKQSELGHSNLSNTTVGKLEDLSSMPYLGVAIRDKIKLRIGQTTDFTQAVIKRSYIGGKHQPLCDRNNRLIPSCLNLSNNVYFYDNWGRLAGNLACHDRYVSKGLYQAYFQNFTEHRNNKKRARQLRELAGQLKRKDCVAMKIFDDGMKDKIASFFTH